MANSAAGRELVSEPCSSHGPQSWAPQPRRGCPPRLASFALGQVISLLTTGTGIFSSLLAAHGVDVPVAQSSLNYVLLALHLPFMAKALRRSGLAVPAWRYGLWALCDVEANFLVVYAYQYTSIASIFLLDCFAIPVAMMTSRALLGARYTRVHIIASCTCVAGLVVTVVSDVLTGKVGTSPKGPAWLGDLLVLMGATLYGFSNVLEEWVLKRAQKRGEAMGMLGLWGTLFSCLQCLALERSELLAIRWSWEKLLWVLGFQLCLFGMYVLTSRFLLRADAALFNLSLLTSDLYSVLFAWRFQHAKLTWLYGLAFATTISGLLMYYSEPAVTPPDLGERQGPLMASG